MSDSQKSHTQTRTAQHTSVANTHSHKGISMPAVPVLQQMKEETEEQKQAADKSYFPHLPASADAGKPGTKPATAFAPVQKKNSPPAETVQRFEIRDKSPARETSDGIAQFKSDNPVQRQGKLYQTSTSVNIREIPDGPVTNTIPVGTIMESLDETQTPGGVWVNVKAPGSTGWVNKEDITAI